VIVIKVTDESQDVLKSTGRGYFGYKYDSSICN